MYKDLYSQTQFYWLMNIVQNILSVKRRIKNACQRAGVDENSIILVAVSKTVPAEIIREAVAHGIAHIGENRVQEAEQKFRQLGRIATWHLVGHLQTNKVKKALQVFDLIQSLDSLHLAEEINCQALRLGRTVDCLVEVNTSGEPSKFGVAPNNCQELIAEISQLPAIHIRGLMTVGPISPDPEQVRPSFRLLRELKESIQRQNFPNVSMDYLSMGMTNDFVVAIEEGANMIRVGRAIYEQSYT